MYLKSISLNGFKSFVDKTTVNLPSPLVAVVGPNGCGKSNIIDAVRWVMGGSPRQLRAEAMEDVIFNGSTDRKPVGAASVELHFDNSDGRIGGAYAHYGEITIRREATRDGQSKYYLNGTHCRRRDIADIFWGTGLGPRSYAIIEQGMISRLIEARPEDLRIHLEEAAGISKYKERRRETELRIQHTRENLSRLSDIRDELDKQLQHLQRQAEAAERYKQYRQEERLQKAQLLVLRWQRFASQVEHVQQQLSIEEQNLERLLSEQQGGEARLTQLRVQQAGQSDITQGIQERYYRVGVEVARLEQQLQHDVERRQQMQAELTQLETNWQETTQHLQEDQQQMEKLQHQIAELQQELTDATGIVQQAEIALQAGEHDTQAWQHRWDEYNQQVAQWEQKAQVLQTQIQHVEQQLQQYRDRLERLMTEQQGLQQVEISPDIVVLQQQINALHIQQTEAQQKASQLQENIQQQRLANQQIHEQLDGLRNQLQGLRGRHASLEALQQAALGQNDVTVMQWLKQQGFDKNDRLAQHMQVETGWEQAVEAVLSDYLQAVVVPEWQTIADSLQDFQEGSLTLFASENKQAQYLPASKTAALLMDKVKAPWPLQALLAGVYVVESLTDAMVLIPQLAANESVVTKQGIRIGPDWLRMSKLKDAKTGMLQRDKELHQLHDKMGEVEASILKQQEALQQGQSQLQHLESTYKDTQQQLTEHHTQQAELRAQLHVKQEKLAHAKERLEQILQEIARTEIGLKQQESDIVSKQAVLAETKGQLELAIHARSSLLGERDTHREILEQARQKTQLAKEDVHRKALGLQACTSQRQSLEQHGSRMQGQLQHLQNRREQLQQFLATPSDNVQGDLEQALQNRLLHEKELSEARKILEQMAEQVTAAEQQRTALEQNLAKVRGQVEHCRVEGQSHQVRLTTLEEQLTEMGQSLSNLRETLPSGLNESELEVSLNKLQARIERLGPINLAAIDEYAQQAERKAYLDTQNADLEAALATLEDAIRKIDRDTRARFKETYDLVNEHFQNLFPRLFGGGSAYLELTGNDLLDTGVAVMARPPGKRNSTIHLLSGGEKALTAVSLVFAIFHLNPAPFCLLDEVDAPLDDANVGRFCQLVKEMSKTVQFIYISHNKVAMEIAQHLLGVTMNEPGVSRLVAVDVDEAVALAAA